jgi:hypothetical protein
MLRSEKRFAGYGKINCMYAFLICRFKNIPMLWNFPKYKCLRKCGTVTGGGVVC